MLARKLGVPLDAMWTGRSLVYLQLWYYWPLPVEVWLLHLARPGPQHAHPLDCATGLNLVSVLSFKEGKYLLDQQKTEVEQLTHLSLFMWTSLTRVRISRDNLAFIVINKLTCVSDFV